MKKRIISVCLAVSLLLAGCSSGTVAQGSGTAEQGSGTVERGSGTVAQGSGTVVQGSRTPEELIERYATALFADNIEDARDRFACMGLALTEEKDLDIDMVLEPGTEWEITSLDIEIYSDSEFDEALVYFEEDWLDEAVYDYNGCELVYSLSDIEQIGKAAFDVEFSTGGGQWRWTYVVKTDLGWFCTG